MDFIRKHSNLTRGQRVLQVAFGSGFKCNSAVWLCLNNPPVKQVDEAAVAAMAAVRPLAQGTCTGTVKPATTTAASTTSAASAAADAEPKKEK